MAALTGVLFLEGGQGGVSSKLVAGEDQGQRRGDGPESLLEMGAGMGVEDRLGMHHGTRHGAQITTREHTNQGAALQTALGARAQTTELAHMLSRASLGHSLGHGLGYISSHPPMDRCEICVYVLERIKQGYAYLLPSICLEVRREDGGLTACRYAE